MTTARPSQAPPLTRAFPPTPTPAPCTQAPHSQVFIQVVVQHRPQLQLLKAANRHRQAEVQVEFSEHSEPDGRGHTQACGGKGVGAGSHPGGAGAVPSPPRHLRSCSLVQTSPGLCSPFLAVKEKG